jgi:hypothetical protein
MRITLSLALFGLLAGWASDCSAQSRPTAPPPLPVSQVQPVLDAAAEAGKFTFIVFSKSDTAASRAMLEVVKAGVAARSENSAWISADANAAGEQVLVEKLGIGRAPMPLTVAIAPNGAVTGIFPKTVKDEQLTACIVPPTMMRCMRSLQDQKLVFVCLTHEADEEAATPAGVQQLQLDPAFKDRVEVVSMLVDDPAEGRFIEQMKIEPKKVAGPYAVLIAPPGVLVGHYTAQATQAEIAAAIHKAGKCCDDPNCKHNQAASSPPPAPRTSARSN